VKTYFITVDPDIALYAEQCGVTTIFVDMETRGKAERQGHLDTHKAAHTLGDVERLASCLSRAELMVRINPPWEGTAGEVTAAVAAGAERLMLPMFTTQTEVALFKRACGPTPVALLVETAAAMARLPAILPLLGREDRIHFGLNDLSIDMKLAFLFEVLAGRLLDGPAAICRAAGVSFGIGGVGRIGHGDLPADCILGEHIRLGSDWVILSRAFHRGAASLAALRESIDLQREIQALLQKAIDWQTAAPEAHEANQAVLADRVAAITRKEVAANE